MRAVQLSGFDAWAHQPAGHRVILSQIPPIRVEIRVFQGHQVKMIEVPLARLER
jgi:hypothetical protein